MFDARMIDAGAPNRDVNARRLIKVRIASSQCDRRRCSAPWWRNRRGTRISKANNPLLPGNHAMTVEKPRIVLRESARKSCAHRQSGHPSASLGDPDGIVGGWERQPEKRVAAFRSLSKPHNISMVGASIAAADQMATPNRAAFSAVATWSRLLDGPRILPIGLSARRARNAARSVGISRLPPFDDHGRSRDGQLLAGHMQ